MNRIPKPCMECGELTPIGNRCAKHQVQLDYKRNHSVKRQAYYDPAYRAFPRTGCIVCGAIVDLERHHIKPLAEGGTNAEDNLTVLCRVCHHSIHNSDWGKIAQRANGIPQAQR